MAEAVTTDGNNDPTRPQLETSLRYSQSSRLIPPIAAANAVFNARASQDYAEPGISLPSKITTPDSTVLINPSSSVDLACGIPASGPAPVAACSASEPACHTSARNAAAMITPVGSDPPLNQRGHSLLQQWVSKFEQVPCTSADSSVAPVSGPLLPVSPEVHPLPVAAASCYSRVGLVGLKNAGQTESRYWLWRRL